MHDYLYEQHEQDAVLTGGRVRFLMLLFSFYYLYLFLYPSSSFVLRLYHPVSALKGASTVPFSGSRGVFLVIIRVSFILPRPREIYVSAYFSRLLSLLHLHSLHCFFLIFCWDTIDGLFLTILTLHPIRMIYAFAFFMIPILHLDILNLRLGRLFLE